MYSFNQKGAGWFNVKNKELPYMIHNIQRFRGCTKLVVDYGGSFPSHIKPPFNLLVITKDGIKNRLTLYGVQECEGITLPYTPLIAPWDIVITKYPPPSDVWQNQFKEQKTETPRPRKNLYRKQTASKYLNGRR